MPDSPAHFRPGETAGKAGMNRKITGETGEKKAHDFLKKKGYHILERNYRCREGEIDIVAERKKCLVFVEVRTRTNTNFMMPVESVSPAKEHRVVAAVYHYLNEHSLDEKEWRIDFIGIEMTPEGKVKNIEHIEGAIGE
jgi:putative endonuclease